MNKSRIKTSAGITQFVFKGNKGQQISANEVYSINNNVIDGLLHLKVISKGSSFKLTYDITGFLPFQDYLKTPLTRATFARLLEDIVRVLKAMQESHFNQQKLLLDFNRVLVNPSTRKIYFIYIPVQPYESGCSLRDFLLNIIQFGSFTAGEDKAYVREYIQILTSGMHFSAFELEEYVRGLSASDSAKEGADTCPQCGRTLKNPSSYCVYCGARLGGNSPKRSGGVYDPLTAGGEEPPAPSVPAREPKKSSTQGLSDSTVVLNTGEIGGTVVLGVDELYHPDHPYLIRKKTQEKIPIRSGDFRIGKERENNDYWVRDNNAVSRRHASILTRDGQYFIVDHRSTNRTYTDGHPIPAETEIEIYSGTSIRLGNEDFDFYIE